MRFVDLAGRVTRAMTFTCPRCRNPVPVDLVFVEGGLPCPYDLPVYCTNGNCFAFVAMANPREVDPPGDLMEDAATRNSELDTPPIELGTPPSELDKEDEVAADVGKIEDMPDQGERPDGSPL